MNGPAKSYETHQERSQRIDTALRYMVLKHWSLTDEGDDPAPVSLSKIADFVGVDTMVIQRIEQSALEKVRSKMNPFLGKM